MDTSTEHRRVAGDRSWQGLALPLVALASSSLLFWLAGLDSGYLSVDSGPYLSIAHHLVEHGRPVSSFGFLGSVEELPAVPGFIPPGLGLWTAAFVPFAGDVVGAGRIVLWLSLLLLQLGAARLLADRTGAPAFAAGASVLLVWNGWTGRFAALLLTELPFLACLALATLAACRVLDGRASRSMRFGLLPLASAMLCLTRYLGVFFPVVFAVVLLWRNGREGRAWPRTAGYLAFYGLASLGPVALWLAVAARSNPALFPDRPPSHLGVGQALAEAGLALAGWVAPWLFLAALLAGVLKLLRAKAPRSRPWSWPELFLALAPIGYLGLLIAVRTRGALYPIGQLGERYLLPVWPFAFLLTALVIHRFVWSRRHLAVRAAVAAAAGAALWLGLQQLLAYRPPPVFPTRTETWAVALQVLPPDGRDVVLCNYCQALAVDRPEARILGIPSRQDFRYEMDLGEVARRHQIGWIVLFDHPAREVLYGPWFSRWLAGPPAGVEIAGGHRLRDGVIYRLASTQAENRRSSSGQSAPNATARASGE